MKNLKTITKNDILNALKAVLSSKFYPFLTAAVTLLCYYLGWDIVNIYFISITGILILLLLDDVSPIISVFLFMSIMISLKNSPSPAMENSDYYFRTEILAQIIVILVLFISAAVYRAIKAVATKKFKFTPMFWGLLAFAAALLLNGMFSGNYNPKNLLYGLIMAASFFAIYCALKDNLKLDEKGFERIAFGFLAFSLVLLIEIIVTYTTTESLFFENHVVKRYKLVFGWGVYNTFGVFMVMCIPAIFYLAGKLKHGYILTAYSVFPVIAVIMSCSKQAMLGAAVVYVICYVLLLVKGKHKRVNAVIAAVIVAALCVVAGVFHNYLVEFIKTTFDNIFVDGELSGSGRISLWRAALDNYRSAPLFGAGFYVEFNYYANSGLGFIPYMCHNTILQLLSSCGTVGIIAYAIHRVQTVRSFCKRVTVERTFIALTIAALLFISLLDNHIFNIFPTIIYSCLISALAASENGLPESASPTEDRAEEKTEENLPDAE